MLIVPPQVSTCPSSQLTDVQTGWTSEIYFVCSGLDEQMSEEAGEHGYLRRNYIFAIVLVAL